MKKSPSPARGVVHRLTLESRCLVGNRAGDPAIRDVYVYTPPDYDAGRRYPLLMDLVGYTGTGASHLNWRPFALNLPERLDRLISAGSMVPCIVVMPDCFTRYAGNQYIDSVGTGAYMTYLCEEVIPFVEGRFSTSGRRGVFGKSSGGYGAIVHAMKRPDIWHAAACHSGDAYFEYVYQADFPRLLKQLMRYDGSVERFLAALEAKEKVSGDEMHALMAIGMAAHYDDDPAVPLGFHLPIDTKTGRLIPERWKRWLKHDPVRMIPLHLDALRGSRGLWIDCGTRDQYHLLWGARMMREELVNANVPHRYEEFDDDHSDIDYRMDRSLPFLAASLS